MSTKSASLFQADVVVIGGGVIGLAITRELAMRGVRKVALIERSLLGTEASSAAAGMLAPQAEADSADEFFKLACRSRDMYPHFASGLLEESGVDVELDLTGTLYLAFTEQDEQEINERFEWQQRAGLSVEKLSRHQALKLEPCVSTAVRAGLRFSNDVQVENRRLVSALANSITRLHANVFPETRVEAVVIERGKVAGVKTDRGQISCGKVVLAAGCWTNEIAFRGREASLNVPIKIEPVRGQMVCLDAKPQLTRHVIYSPRGYIVPRRDGRLLAGSTSEAAGFTKVTTAGGVNSILTNATEISSGIANLAIASSWAGLRPKASDGLPVIGACDEIEGLVYATGHYRNGILLAPITGELVARLVLGEEVQELGPFGPDRFQTR